MNRSKPFPFHPFIAALYPILALLAVNVDETPLKTAARSLFASLVLMALFWLLFGWLTKGRGKAALLTSATLIIFFAYGHLSNYIHYPLPILQQFFGNHITFLPGVLLLLALLAWWVLRRLDDTSSLTANLNAIAVVLLIFPLYQIISFQIILNRQANAPESASPAEVSAGDQLPDVYLLILDMYARADLMESEMNFDNSPFLDELSRDGFDVVRCSRSNYSITRFSLTAMFNMDYLPNVIQDFNPNMEERSTLDVYLQHGTVRQQFEALGYKTIAFQTGFAATEWSDADIFYQMDPENARFSALSDSESNDWFNTLLGKLNINKFEWLLIQTSAARIIPDAYLQFAGQLYPEEPSEKYIDRLFQYQLATAMLEKLAVTPDIPGPKLVFFHLVIPHPPFVFSPDGSFRAPIGSEQLGPAWYLGYTDQVQYINSQVSAFIEDVLNNSATPPIIIIMGDHATPIEERPGYQRNEILNTYYFPGANPDEIAPSTSPVNTFRIIFNQYFNGNYDILPDEAYTSDFNDTPFQFEEVTEVFPECIQP